MTSLNISKITDFLYISAWPEGRHTDEVIGLGIRLILSMHWRRPNYALNRPPLRIMWLPTFDNAVVKMPMFAFKMGVSAARPVIQDGGAVLCHCLAGVHRSVAMACCILISQGYSTDEAMQLVKSQREVADPEMWYIQHRIRKFEEIYKKTVK